MGNRRRAPGFVISGRHCQFVQGSDKTYKPIASVAAVSERPVQGYSTARERWCIAAPPDVSLRGAKRRGNLAVPDWTTGKLSAKSQLPSRDCHVGLRPPRNDKPVCLTPPNHCPNTCDCLWRSLSAATNAIGACRFIGSLFVSAALRRERHAAPLQRTTENFPLSIFRSPTHKTAGRRKFPRPAGPIFVYSVSFCICSVAVSDEPSPFPVSVTSV